MKNKVSHGILNQEFALKIQDGAQNLGDVMGKGKGNSKEKLSGDNILLHYTIIM